MPRHPHHIIPAPIDDGPSNKCAGRVSYVEDLPIWAKGAPADAVLYAPGSCHQPSILQARSLHWPVGSKKSWRLSPLNAWGDVDPEEAADAILPLLSRLTHQPAQKIRWPASYGAAAKALLLAWTEQGNKDVFPCLKPQQIPALRMACRGGIQRTQQTYAPDATYLDLRRAYASVLEGPLPSGYGVLLPKKWRGGTTTAECLERIKNMHAQGYAGILTCQLESPDGLVLLDPEYRQNRMRTYTYQQYPTTPVVWIGPSNELEAILEGNIAHYYHGQIDGVAYSVEGIQGHCYPMTQRFGGLMAQLKELPEEIYKLIYKSIWPQFDATGGWVGTFSDTPPEDSTMEYKRDPRIKDLWWGFEPPPVEGDGQIFRPDVVAWVTGGIRARLYKVWRAWKPLMAMVDALIVPASTSEEWMPEIAHIMEGATPQTGEWRPEASGAYFGVAPGQYLIGGRVIPGNPSWRIRLCGVPNGGQGFASLLKLAKKEAWGLPKYDVKWIRGRLDHWAADTSAYEFMWPSFEPRPENQRRGNVWT